MYRDLLEKYKKRSALISSDYKSLKIIFEFRSTPIGLNVENIQKKLSFFNGELSLSIEDNKYFYLEFLLREENLALLYQITLIISYILGRNIKLQYYYKNFPYYPTDIYFNLHSSNIIHDRLLKYLIDKPGMALSKFLKLLEENNKVFKMLAPDLLQLNSSRYIDVIFIAEYGLLQRLASSYDSVGILFLPDSKESFALKEFAEKVNKLLEIYPLIQEKIKNKLSFEKLNERANTKEKIKLFLEKFRNGRFIGYRDRVDRWNYLRSKVIVHGTSRSGIDELMSNPETVKELHDLLLKILECEINEEFF